MTSSSGPPNCCSGPMNKVGRRCPGSRGSGYGIFAAGFGVTAFVGGVLYDVSIRLLIVIAIRAAALILLAVITRLDRI